MTSDLQKHEHHGKWYLEGTCPCGYHAACVMKSANHPQWVPGPMPPDDRVMTCPMEGCGNRFYLSVSNHHVGRNWKLKILADVTKLQGDEARKMIYDACQIELGKETMQTHEDMIVIASKLLGWKCGLVADGKDES